MMGDSLEWRILRALFGHWASSTCATSICICICICVAMRSVGIETDNNAIFQMSIDMTIRIGNEVFGTVRGSL